ncbi:prefoldin subunit alpha [Candidatus Pacearchaeota archaeon RBG_16_35_8]|uniref:Prefoldin subunit alpha n=1 Tax=uncultured archaeon Rifle_16ft_4_minimus_1461 TaxID=1665151 RepID=A0A0H4TKP4_9ARCH|nr:prefoldin subunit alpha, prefoldin alpha subunit [uncultured archaeon Rifle_16ft_4_minimus_1461]OGJ12689.1 MAG: prefoldin subunit alpha [Candidatus Pacearchaeota archaeon RBG_16_35_8]
MENNGKNAEKELMIKFSMFEQQIRQIQQQLEVLERNILEMNSLNFGLDEFKGAKGKDVLAQVGKNIFVKTKLAAEDLIVDIGNGNFVKKNIDDTKKLIGEQTKKLEKIRDELNSALESINQEMTSLILNAQGNK